MTTTTEAPSTDLQSELVTIHRNISHGPGRYTTQPNGITVGDVAKAFDLLHVHSEPAYQQVLDANGVGFAPIEGRQLIAKDHGGRVLAIPGAKSYVIHQYDESILGIAADVLQASDGQARIAAHGQRNYGGQAFVQVELADPIVLADDSVHPFLFLSGSHDGSLRTTARLGANRLICTNMLAGVFKHWQKIVGVKHTTFSEKRLIEARTLVTDLTVAATSLKHDIQRLLDIEVTTAEFGRIAESLYPKPKDGEERGDRAAHTRWETRRDILWDLWRNDPRVAPWTGTGWGALQAFNTYHQHEMPVRVDRTDRSIDRFVSGDVLKRDTKVVAAIDSVALAN